MRTRSQNNIFKPNLINNTTKHPLPSSLEPSCVFQALKDPQWRMAMSEEFIVLVRNGTWELVPSHSFQNIVGCKGFFFHIKRNSDGSIQQYKVKLVVMGFHPPWTRLH